jgi:hypothetical protein
MSLEADCVFFTMAMARAIKIRLADKSLGHPLASVR